ncbi:hypothetical protein [Streptosporangium sp. NPDC006007]|uniref:hypothetical protein n=1 Tax=Streptosporangium sp. NPDC006007 TaxID=3154575 RepID=UPI0033ABBF9C
MNKQVDHYLLVLAERRAIAWVLTEQRMAFPPTARSEVRDLKPGDELFVYVTRGAYQNPGRDRGRVVGRAVVVSQVELLEVPLKIGAKTYPRGCLIDVQELADWGTGVEVVPLLSKLEVFPDPGVWSAQLRRPLLRLPARDADLFRVKLANVARDPDEVLASYVDRAEPVRGRS